MINDTYFLLAIRCKIPSPSGFLSVIYDTDKTKPDWITLEWGENTDLCGNQITLEIKNPGKNDTLNSKAIYSSSRDVVQLIGSFTFGDFLNAYSSTRDTAIDVAHVR